jgi:hypothetical protein
VTHLSVSLSALGPPVTAPSLSGCHAPRHKSVGRQRRCLNAATTSRLASCAADHRCPKPTALPSRQPRRCLTTVLTGRSEAAAHLWFGRRRRRLRSVSRCAAAFTAPPPAALVPFRRHCLRLGSHRVVPSACRRLHRELSCATVHAPVRPRHAFPRAASRAPVKSPPQSTRAALQRCRTHCVTCTRVGPSWARPWAAHTLRRPRPSRARPGHAHVVQAGRTCTVQLGRARIQSVTVELFFYFSNIFKSLQIQKFV